LNILSKTRSLVDQRLVPELEKIINQAQAERPRADNARVDAYGDEIARLMSLIRSRIFGEFSDREIADLTRRVAQAVSEQNKRGIGGVFKDVLGVDVFAAEPWLAAETRAFVESNVNLIKTIPEQYLGRVEQMVYDGARRGTSWRDVAANLEDGPYDSSKYRAERIARDQIGKFNGQLTELRQTQAGVSSYVWRTSLDERVRDEHAQREGKKFDWSDPPADGHPGEAINCRCYAEPVLEDLIDQGDE
jgi:SPP1 gp7 family putative phage head morphogenesis protein